MELESARFAIYSLANTQLLYCHLDLLKSQRFEESLITADILGHVRMTVVRDYSILAGWPENILIVRSIYYQLTFLRERISSHFGPATPNFEIRGLFRPCGEPSSALNLRS
jgi:hypothetical protein